MSDTPFPLPSLLPQAQLVSLQGQLASKEGEATAAAAEVEQLKAKLGAAVADHAAQLQSLNEQHAVAAAAAGALLDETKTMMSAEAGQALEAAHADAARELDSVRERTCAEIEAGRQRHSAELAAATQQREELTTQLEEAAKCAQQVDRAMVSL